MISPKISLFYPAILDLYQRDRMIYRFDIIDDKQKQNFIQSKRQQPQ